MRLASMHLASLHLVSLHLAIKSYLAAGERYRLSPHGSNPRYFFSARSPGMLEGELWRREAEPGHRSPAAPTMIRFFLAKSRNRPDRCQLPILLIDTTDAHSHSAGAISFTRAVPEAFAIGQLLAAR